MNVYVGNCNGGRGHYRKFCYGQCTGDREREDDTQKWFDRLYRTSRASYGCLHAAHGHCRCTVETSLQWI